MQIKTFSARDASLIARLFVDSINILAADAYSPAQRAAWAMSGQNPEHLSEQLQEGTTFVLWDDSKPLGFGQLHPSDHVNMLYTSPAAARQGCASRIYAQLEEFAIAAGSRSLYTEASHVSQPFFASKGFRILEKEIVVRDEVQIERFRMRKDLSAAAF